MNKNTNEEAAEKNLESDSLQEDSEELLEQELNEFLLSKLESLLPFINEHVERRQQLTIEDFKEALHIRPQIKKCSYTFKRGVNANITCNNICFNSEKNLCNKCDKRVSKDFRTMKLFPSFESPNIFYDDQGIRFRKNEDNTLEVIDVNLLDEKRKKKLEKNGVKI
jgi:hypothetical protein